MKFAIVGHPSRARAALDLTTRLSGVLFMDHRGAGAYANHRRALEWAARQEDRVTIVEDDALPVDRAVELAEAWADWYPNELLSFYLGTGHPREWQALVDDQLNGGTDVVCLPKLIHGVAYSLPQRVVRHVLDAMEAGPADFAIGDAWVKLTGRPVVYPVESLFDHDDGPSIVQGQRARTPRAPRRARLLAA